MEFDRDTWRTPQWLFDFLNDRYEFTLDAFADDNNHLCYKYFTKEQDALNQSWAGHSVFCNPPYSKGNIEKCLKKCNEERDITLGIVVVIPLDVCSWGRKYIWGKASEIIILDERISFLHPVTGKEGKSPSKGTMVVTYGDYSGFTEVTVISVSDIRERSMNEQKKSYTRASSI